MVYQYNIYKKNKNNVKMVFLVPTLYIRTYHIIFHRI